MAQTTGATSGTNCLIELSVASVWTDISGSANQVTAPEQSRMSGEAYTFTGDTAIVKAGKREPVEVTFRCVYTESNTEAFDYVRAMFEASGGTAAPIRWTPISAGQVYTILAGIVTKFGYPAADAGEAAPIVCEWTIKGSAITVT